MDLPNILNNKGPAAAAEQLQQQLEEAARAKGRTISEVGSGPAFAHNLSDDPSRFSSQSTGPQLHNLNMANASRYTNSVPLQQQFPMIPNPYPTPTGSVENGYANSQHGDDPRGNQLLGQPGQPEPTNQVKAFACSNCGKGFARRSDLARHERIHTGVRPHVCKYPGCDKQFIQRSALTVHERVHTGEKPHMCEHCTKPFSDSSSLARHRRIHSGKRPYKCPYADCQKTFTRRTTLTRHQSHHTGTVEEAAAATAAALASRPPTNGIQRTRSDGGAYSETASSRTTPSPSQRTISMSPSSDMPQMPILHRHHSDFSFMASGTLPPHLRADHLSQHSPRSGSTSPTLSVFGAGAAAPHHRPSMTSHPNMYGPPPTLEPPTQHEQRGAPGSASGSPHLGSVGWPSPTHGSSGGGGSGSMGSPLPATDSYLYPEPGYGMPGPSLYYPSSNMRRPQSTEPDQYETKPRMLAGEVWGQM